MSQKSPISSRIAQVEESATLAIDAKAKSLKASGVDVIGFGAGEPDFPTPEFIVEAAIKAAQDPKNHKYTPAIGLLELREAISLKTRRDSGLEFSPNQIIVTNGGKHAIFNTIMTLVDEGDEVLIPSPYWTTYPELVKLAGGVPVAVPTSIREGYKVTPQALEPYITERTKLFIHVSPSNPTGAVYSPEETFDLGRFLLDKGLWVMTDEIYEHLTYDEVKSTPILSSVPELTERTVIVNGVAKTYAMTGWRIGWMISPPQVHKAASNLQSQVTSNISNISQRAAVAALLADLSCLDEMRTAFDRRRKTMVAMLSEIDGFNTLEPEGAFYVFPDVSGVFGRSIGDTKVTSSMDLTEVILEQAEVAVVPGEAFGAPGHLRLSYALADSALVEGLERIQKLLQG
ncbi:L-aspartate aminotransferase apoenzyme [Ferrithrix thermotolerans DSM 19514]|jgi:aspartate aminotransferase|uniref:Aminotransferase n=1 Tax=Ferrithrix thermotolerans DSM 19514 TaxID=1121881 RepID=A0A1M4TVK9_9ACTN|nr:pyridoxal phosphate-dependent aminotransferase [Ferrithrix thermotolerans]SHE48498.1 L-aspartate aminotransferase apoenzyme [Ferrithrix thermotolerans DSM 19514]